MTTQEAEDLLRRTEGRLCVRFYRRSDGTILTGNCPVGLRAIRDRLSRIRISIIAAVLSFIGHLGFVGGYRMFGRQLGAITAITSGLLIDERTYAFQVTAARVPPMPIMGAIACPPYLLNPGLPIRSESFVRKRAIFRVMPIFHSAGFSSLRGDVVVKIVIDEDGSVDSAELVSGNPLIAELAEEAASRWKFKPILVNGQPARVESRLTFSFGK